MFLFKFFSPLLAQVGFLCLRKPQIDKSLQFFFLTELRNGVVHLSNNIGASKRGLYRTDIHTPEEHFLCTMLRFCGTYIKKSATKQKTIVHSANSHRWATTVYKALLIIKEFSFDPCWCSTSLRCKHCATVVCLWLPRNFGKLIHNLTDMWLYKK